MLIPAFKLNLGNAIRKGMAAIGYFDGTHPSLTCATDGDKVFIHSPHVRTDEFEQEIRFLNINHRITALCAGRLDASLGRDVLMLGTETNVHVYDVEKNSDLFYVDAADGVTAMLFGQIGSMGTPLAIVGGNCSIQGFDMNGDEKFWTVTGDNVSALTFCDVDEDGEHELLVGSEDYEIRIFQNEEVISETTESDVVVALCPLKGTRYGYALANGTIGVYDNDKRVWRVKSKHRVTAIAGFDLDGDGVPELISGWSNGKVEVRNEHNGELIYKEYFDAPIAAIVQADYRMDGRVEIIVCAENGEVRGFFPSDSAMEGNMAEGLQSAEDVMRGLREKKQLLLAEMQNYADGTKAAKGSSKDGADAKLIPADTQLNTSLVPNMEKRCVDLVLQTNNFTIIQLAAVFGDQLFAGESHISVPADGTPSGTLRVPLAPPRDVAQGTALMIKALVGNRGSELFHVFEISKQLPKFAMYMADAEPEKNPTPTSYVAFQVDERVSRISMWLESAFEVDIASAGKAIEKGKSTLKANFLSLRTGLPLRLELRESLELRVQTDSMEVAGEVIQHLCAYLQIEELQCVAHFPREMEAFKAVLHQVNLFNQTRLKLSAEMADSSNLVKALVIKAEDARILGDMSEMRAIYSNLFDLNRDLLIEHKKRNTNHTQLLSSLKEVNHMIQKAARLRVGSFKMKVVNAAREAIKTNNIKSLLRIIETGENE